MHTGTKLQSAVSRLLNGQTHTHTHWRTDLKTILCFYWRRQFWDKCPIDFQQQHFWAHFGSSGPHKLYNSHSRLLYLAPYLREAFYHAQKALRSFLSRALSRCDAPTDYLVGWSGVYSLPKYLDALGVSFSISTPHFVPCRTKHDDATACCAALMEQGSDWCWSSSPV